MTGNIGKKHLGSNFDDFLIDENILEKCTTAAEIRVEHWKNEQDKGDRSPKKTKD